MPISRWNSDLWVPYVGYASTFATASYAPDFDYGGPVGFELPGSAGLNGGSLIGVQIPSPALNDVQVTTIGVSMGLFIIQTVSGGAGPGTIVSATAVLQQNNVPFFSIPLSVGKFAVVGYPSLSHINSVFTLVGTLTPQNPFPVYLSDNFEVTLLLELASPVPQQGGGTPPAGQQFIFGLVVRENLATVGAGNPTFASKLSFIGTSTAKDDLF